MRNADGGGYRFACLACILLAINGCGGGSASSPPSNPPELPPSPPPTQPSPPTGLSYANPSNVTVGVTLDGLMPSVSGTVDAYSIDPPLPNGLAIDTTTGEISGTPLVGTPESSYTIVASNADGEATFQLLITVLLPRSTEDRPDRSPGEFQVHAIYAIPADGADRMLDLDGTIEHSLRSSNAFFLDASGGQTIRYDEVAENLLDVSFLRLPNNDTHYASMGVFARDALEVDTAAAGFNDAKKLYLVYYDGANAEVCGGAPPLGSGNRVTALYLQGTPPGSTECASNEFAATNDDAAWYWEWAAAHEVVHALGFVDACSPNHFNAHTGDDPSDLMYAGDEPWAPATVDVGQDDYYGANVPAGCARNLFFSAFLFPQQGNELPPGL